MKRYLKWANVLRKNIIFVFMKKEVARFLLDVAKLLVGGILLTGIMRQDISPKLLFLSEEV